MSAAASERTFQISVYRYNPEVDKKPKMQHYEVDSKKIQGQMLLDAIHVIKEMDSSLVVRQSCREGVCGSDGMNINGRNGLACVTKLKELPNKITLRPLPGFPVIRDLVVDMTNFYRQYERAQPYLINDGPTPATERLQSPKERAKLDGLYECILCACCTSSCPSYWWNPDKFLGPAALLQAERFIADSRDTATPERLKNLDDAYKLFRCRGIMNCVDVCPKGLNPRKAIADITDKMVDEGS